jgi:Tol biopolymer transport system component
MLVVASVGVGAASFDFYRAGPNVVGLFNNLTGGSVDELVLRFSGPVVVAHAVGIGGDMRRTQGGEGELRYTGHVAPEGTMEVDWPWDGPRLEYAAWLREGVVVEEIPVHNPTAAFGMIGGYAGQRIRFFAPASGDPDGEPLAKYLWTWSDGATAEGVRVERTFVAGEYWVALTVEDADGNKSSRVGKFEVACCTLTIRIEGDGSVSQQPDRTCYEYGEAIVLNPTPAAHWHFAGWEGDLSGAGDPVTIRIHGDTVITAVFERELQSIAFSYRDDIFIIREDGTGLRNVTNSPYWETGVQPEPVASDSITFYTSQFGGQAMGVMEISGGPVSLVSQPGQHVESPRWSVPATLAYVGGGANGDIYLVNPDGTNLRRLTTEGYWYAANISPDGTRICAQHGSTHAVYLMDIDGTNRQFIGYSTITGTWSPDGRSIALTWRNDLTLVDPVTLSQRVILHASDIASADHFFYLEVSWSPDAQHLAFNLAADASDKDAWVVDATGDNAMPISAAEGVDERISEWSPAGDKVLCMVEDSVYLYNADTRTFDFLTRGAPGGWLYKTYNER